MTWLNHLNISNVDLEEHFRAVLVQKFYIVKQKEKTGALNVSIK